MLLMDHLLLILGMLVVLFWDGWVFGLVFVVCRAMHGVVVVVSVGMMMGLELCCIPWKLMVIYYY